MKRVLLLMSDTGGGHRAAAEAIRDAMLARYEGQVQIEMIDVFRAYSPFPYKYMPEMYPWLINHSKSSWGLGYKLTNTQRRAMMLSHTMYMSMDRRLRRMVREHPADVVVCVHSVLTRPSMQALMRLEKRPPFVVVVTDLVSTHYFWYDTRADVTLVPTEPAFERGRDAGLSAKQMKVTGLPVHPRFAERLEDKAQARRELGWDPNLPAVLIVGGGDGMGPLYKTARAINERNLKCQLVIIAGRNKALKQQIDSATWNQPTKSYGFVTNMPQLMSAADVLVTKAGPATISEACIAGLPMILYDAIPGQETGNVEYVVQNNAGVFAPNPREVADALEGWMTRGTDGLKRLADNARGLARANAVWDIAEEVWKQAQRNPIPTNRRNAWLALARPQQRIRRVRRLARNSVKIKGL